MTYLENKQVSGSQHLYMKNSFNLKLVQLLFLKQVYSQAIKKHTFLLSKIQMFLIINNNSKRPVTPVQGKLQQKLKKKDKMLWASRSGKRNPY